MIIVERGQPRVTSKHIEVRVWYRLWCMLAEDWRVGLES